jgi:DNA-binding CsgD family transcriptional regulator/PAS domain-containing protein
MPKPRPPAEPRLGTILELIGLIYESVADASRWQTFLDAFVGVVRARGAVLALRDSKHADFTLVRWSGWSDEDIRMYMEHYSGTDPWRIGTVRWPEGVVATDLDLCPRQVMESSAAFREFYRPRDGVHGFGGTILVTGTGQSVITAIRTSAAGPFGEPEEVILRALMPHLKRAALLHGELGSTRSQLITFTGHLDRYPHSFLLIDAERRILYANAAAREIADLKDGLVMEAGQISLMSGRLDALFHRAVGKMASDHNAPLLRLEVPRPSRKKPYRLMLMPIHGSGIVPLGVSLAAVTVLVIDSDSQPEPELAILRELFSLTPAEARIAAKLVLGRSVEEIAAEGHISVLTVRTHVKRILSKTATSRQAELISLILRSVPFRSF